MPNTVGDGSDKQWLAVSETNGGFKFDDLPRGSFRLEVSASGFQPFEMGPIEVGGEEPSPGVHIQLFSGAIFEGTVSSPDGVPVASARLTKLEADERHSDLAFTDDQGRFSNRELQPGPLTFRVEHQDFPSTQQALTLAVGMNNLDVHMPASWTISGVVLDSGGQVSRRRCLGEDPRR